MNPVIGLSLGRIAIGVASIAQPARVSALLAPSSPASSPLMTQWFGTREVALGLVTLLSSGSARRNLVLTGMLVDAGDAGTAYLGLKNGTLPRQIGWGAVSVAVGAVVAAPVGLLATRSTKRAAKRAAARQLAAA